MKKFSVIAMFVLVLCFVGCENRTATSSPDNATSTTSTEDAMLSQLCDLMASSYKAGMALRCAGVSESNAIALLNDASVDTGNNDTKHNALRKFVDNVTTSGVRKAYSGAKYCTDARIELRAKKVKDQCMTEYYVEFTEAQKESI